MGHRILRSRVGARWGDTLSAGYCVSCYVPPCRIFCRTKMLVRPCAEEDNSLIRIAYVRCFPYLRARFETFELNDTHIPYRAHTPATRFHFIADVHTRW